MKSLRWAVPALACVWAGSVLMTPPLNAQERASREQNREQAAPAAGRAEGAGERAAGRGMRGGPASARIVRPWSLITTLSDEQKTKIREIHRKALDEINAIEARERDAVMALLTVEQKAELKAAQDKEAAERRANRAQARQRAEQNGAANGGAER